jgi:nucleotide-binding universal stress UspA family protein
MGPSSSATPAQGIVVAYDGSPGSEAAAAWAGRAAALWVVPATALLVASPGVSPGTSRVQSRQQLEDRSRRRLEDCGAPDVRVEWGPGPMVDALVASARTASMLVVATPQQGLAVEAALASVRGEAERGALSPVVVVRPRRHRDSGRVVVGVDGSRSSRRALDFACTLAALVHDRVAVVCAGSRAGVAPADHHACASGSGSFVLEPSALDAVVNASRAQHSGLSIEPDAIATSPGRALVDASAHADLVVMGSRGLSFVEATARGSASRYVVRRAQCPVAVVH